MRERLLRGVAFATCITGEKNNRLTVRQTIWDVSGTRFRGHSFYVAPDAFAAGVSSTVTGGLSDKVRAGIYGDITDQSDNGWYTAGQVVGIAPAFATGLATGGTGALAIASKAFATLDTAHGFYESGSKFANGEPLHWTDYASFLPLGGAATTHIAGPFASRFRSLIASGDKNDVIYTTQNDINKIWDTQRVWGLTEGAVYGMPFPNAPRWRTMVNPHIRDPGDIIFKDGAASLFKPHEVWGPFSGIKKLVGQQKSDFGDIVFDQASRDGSVITVTAAHIGSHAGQSQLWAASRLWGRRSLDIAMDAGFIVGVGYGVVYVLND